MKNFIKANPVKAHPYYWAGFVVSGDVAEVATKLPFYQNVFFIITSAFLSLLFCFFTRRKNNVLSTNTYLIAFSIFWACAAREALPAFTFSKYVMALVLSLSFK